MSTQAPMRQAEPNIPCVDVWPLPALTRHVQEAYNVLARLGEINVKKITVKKSAGVAVVEYLSTLPQDWTRQALKKAKEEYNG